MESIAPLLAHEYEHVLPYTSVTQVKDVLFRDGFVALHDDSFVGLLTLSDYIRKPKVLAVDCLCQKPLIRLDTPLKKIIQHFTENDFDALPVKLEGGKFAVLTRTALLKHLLNAQSEQKKKAVSNRFMQIISHDLRAPLNRLSTLSELMENTQDTEQIHSELLPMLRLSVREALELTQNLHDFYLLDDQEEEKLELVEVDMRDFLSACAAGYQFDGAYKKINVVLETMPTASCNVTIDAAKARRVLGNIVSNAIKFSHPKGTITLSCQQEQGQVVIICQDKGVGISKEKQKTLFSPLDANGSSGTQGEPSSGLGLFIAKQLIEEQGGDIHIESQEGEGTRVTLCFPGASDRS